MARKDLGVRPICQTPGCSNECELTGTSRAGKPIWRKTCRDCKNHKICKSHGVENVLELTAARNGFRSVSSYRDSLHPTRRFLKNYCENIDGRLGFYCTSTIKISSQLQADHIYPRSHAISKGWSLEKIDSRDNIQTLCVCCHTHKTIMNKDNHRKIKRPSNLTQSLESYFHD